MGDRSNAREHVHGLFVWRPVPAVWDEDNRESGEKGRRKL